MTARSTWETSQLTTVNNLYFGGVAGNNTGTLIPNNTQSFPSIQAIESAFAAGSITQAQRIALKQATNMNAQESRNLNLSTLRDSGDKAPA